MAEKLRIFVSATHDLERERAVIGRAVADLPVQIGIEIRRTPVTGAAYDDIFELVANVDRFYFLLGRDITAPAGAEWYLAWKLERSVLPLAAQVRRSPAAQEFGRAALIEWKPFRTRRELFRLITLDLTRILNHPTNRYGLTVTELELLNLHAQRIQRRAQQAADVPAGAPEDGSQTGAGGAEGGGILLDSTRRDELDDELLVEG